MFCKYCGKGIPDGSVFCTACGRKIGTTPDARPQPKERNRFGILYLIGMVGLLCYSTWRPLWRILIYGESFSLTTLMTIAALLAALVLLIVLISYGVISPKEYRLSDLLTVIVLAQILPRLLAVPIIRILSGFYGQAGLLGFSAINEAVLPVFQFEGIWLILGLILLGLERRKRWYPGGKHWVLLVVFLALRTLLSVVMVNPLLRMLGVEAEAFQNCTKAAQAWTVLNWLLPVSIILTFHLLGCGKIGSAGAAVALCVTRLAELFLLPLLTIWLNLGFPGYGLSLGLAPLFSFVVLAIASRWKKAT